jgi:ABC-type dipeptide/oligopeptide/nickel transport system permease component
MNHALQTVLLSSSKARSLITRPIPIFTFILKKIGYGLLVMLGVISIVFFLFHVLPGNPASLMAGQRTDVSTVDAIEKEFGLKEPLYKQFLFYINDLSFVSLHEDSFENEIKYEYTASISMTESLVLVVKAPYLRRSFQTNKKVSEILMEDMEGTFWLAFASMFFASVIGIWGGVIAAIRKGTWVDHVILSSSVVGVSIPSYVAAVLISLIFGYYLSDYTGLNLTGQLWESTPLAGRKLHLENLILPALTLGLRPLSMIVQLTRGSMLDALSQDYVRTARAKGLSSRVVVFKHALRNALNPVITAISGWLAAVLTGAFFVEYIYGWKGIGTTTIKAVTSLDLPVVMGATLLIAIIFVIINSITDIVYAWIDPRIRLK